MIQKNVGDDDDEYGNAKGVVSVDDENEKNARSW